jgi:TRAP-type C4-dicarboxylate transport system permease small subunit
MYVVSGITLTSMMLITVLDIILRPFGKPLTGTYELVALSGAITAGFSIPYTSWVRGHIYMEFIIDRLSKGRKEVMLVFTRVLNIFLFIALGVVLFESGASMRASGEVSMTLQIPFYPVAYAVGVCSFMQCIVLICDIVKIARGEYE